MGNARPDIGEDQAIVAAIGVSMAPPSPAPAPAQPNLQNKAARGSLWAMVGFAGGHGLRLASNLLLTRMVAPEAFGVMLLVNVVLLGLEQFADVGIGPSIIQNEKEDRNFLDTAWTIQAIRGAILTCAAAAIAYPMARFYEEPSLLALVMFAGLSSIVAGLRSTKTFTANRHLAIKRLTAVDFACRVFSMAVTLGWAYVSPSVWALAAGSVAFAVSQTVLSHVALPGHGNRFHWDRDAAKSLFRFGRWVFFSTLLGFVASQADRVLFGKIVDLQTLGVYSVASLLAMTPQQVIRHLALSVNFPLYSQTHRSGGDLPEVFRQSRRRLLVLAGGACSLMIAGGPAIVSLLYEDTFLAAGWMMQWLAVGTWFNALEVTVASALLARGESLRVALAALAKVLAMLVLIPLGFVYADFPGAIAGFAVSEVVRYLCIALLARPARLRGGVQALRYTLLTAGVSGIGYAAVHATLHTFAWHMLWVNVVVAVVVGALWLPLVLPMLRRTLRPSAP